jgi:DNA-binding transcriptional ArsR family regulator
MATSGPALDALGDPTRRAILELVAQRPRAVGELAAQLPVSRPAVSQHLKVLKAARLVHDTAQGRQRIYRVDAQGLEAVRRYLDRFWEGALAAFAAAVEEEAARDARAEEEHP